MLVDTSVWINHLRRGNPALARQLSEREVWCHPFVIGELACGRLEARSEVLALLSALPRTPLAEHDEVLAFVGSNRLAGTGIGWVDAHLLAAARLAGIGLWTLDKPLAAVALELGLCVEPE